MRVHILGICGTFMGGIAAIARQLGHEVTGCDANVYPPMSDQLRDQGIDLIQGYDPSQLDGQIDAVIVGNAMKRGNPCVERALNDRMNYVSGPAWLEECVLRNKTVLGVAGTHGKTTTASMLAWVLEYAGKNPGFLIGGVPENFGVSARVTDSEFFVIEADEYDCAFFDKRSKFVHYRPSIQILNNLEYDHADIFASVAEIEKQFHHLVRTIPSKGHVIVANGDEHLANVMAMGCWSNTEYVGGDDSKFKAQLKSADGSSFEVFMDGISVGTVDWEGIGAHNVHNALMVISAAEKAGVEPSVAVQALCGFKMPKRRMELKGVEAGVCVYDDFAHHPTAIETTVAGLRAKVGKGRILAVLEPRSNTMKLGVHRDLIGPSLKDADMAFVYAPDSLTWDADAIARNAPIKVSVFQDFDAMLAAILQESREGDSILVMSNGGFGGIHGKLLAGLGK